MSRQCYLVALGMMVTYFPMQKPAPVAITNSNSDRYAKPYSTLKQNITDASYEHDIENLISSPACTSNQMKTIRQHLGRPRLLIKATSCPEATWIEKFYEEDALLDHFVGISVGCNKGNDAIRTARMGMSVSGFNESSWNEAFMDASQTNISAYNCNGAEKPIKITSPPREMVRCTALSLCHQPFICWRKQVKHWAWENRTLSLPRLQYLLLMERFSS